LTGAGVPRPDYHPPLKRSMTIAGHQTSISLEPAFWAAVVAEVDAARLSAARVPNLTSALRQYLFGLASDRGAEAGGAARGETQP
jgi:predicted DNA-binding ribbon-helix-helix protein